MAYETTVGWDQRLYEVTVTSTPSTIYDLLSQADKDELAAVRGPCNDDRLVILDGFVYADEGGFDVQHKVGGAVEVFKKGTTALFPFVEWHKKALISASVDTIVLVKLIIGFTKLPA